MPDTFWEGNAATITETFVVGSTPTDPTSVTFTIRFPDHSLVDYVMGVAPEVTNPDVGVYELAIAATFEPGPYLYRVVGTGAVAASAEGDFVIRASPTLGDLPAPAPLAPCAPWVDADEVAAQCDTSLTGTNVALYEQAAMVASELLFMLSGGQFGGACERTERPCSTELYCAWSTGIVMIGLSGPFWVPWNGSYNWILDEAPRCSCQSLSRVPLPGYPVQEVLEVLIDGDVVDPTTYRVDDYMWLTRVTPDADETMLRWPSCQNQQLPPDQPGTWQVTYTAGLPVPEAGRFAASELGCQIALAGSLQECVLPDGVTQINRAGLTISRELFKFWGQKEGMWMTGMTWVDAFLQAYNPDGRRGSGSVWSPDLQQVN